MEIVKEGEHKRTYRFGDTAKAIPETVDIVLPDKQNQSPQKGVVTKKDQTNPRNGKKETIE